MSACQGCGVDLPPSKARPRKWCSDRCRKQTLYSRDCIDCGTKLSGSDGLGPNAPLRCVQCNGPHVAQLNKVWTREAIITAIREWAAEHNGEHPTILAWSPTHARHLGCQPNLDYLNEPDRWPHAFTVLREFGEGDTTQGGWRAAMLAAGFTPRNRGQTLARLRAAA